MADQSDVEQALAATVAATLYPNGPDRPSRLGRLVRVYRGAPQATTLDADLAAGHINVTVFPDPRHQRNTTRYPDEWCVTDYVTPTLVATVNKTIVTFAGIATPGQVAGILVDNRAATQRTAKIDSAASVAARLAAQLRPYRVANLAGTSVTFPGAGSVIARVVADQPARRETRRQSQGFRLTIWCADPAIRDATASLIDGALSVVHFLNLPDGTTGHLSFRASVVSDREQGAALYRRDLLYAVDYATTLADTLPSMLFGDAEIIPGLGGTPQTFLS